MPYSTEPGSQPIILRHGDLATLETVRAPRRELPASTPAIFVERESLLSRAPGEDPRAPDPARERAGRSSLELARGSRPVDHVARSRRRHRHPGGARPRALRRARVGARDPGARAAGSSRPWSSRGRVKNLSQGKDETLTSDLARVPGERHRRHAPDRLPAARAPPAGLRCSTCSARTASRRPTQAVQLRPRAPRLHRSDRCRPEDRREGSHRARRADGIARVRASGFPDGCRRPGSCARRRAPTPSPARRRRRDAARALPGRRRAALPLGRLAARAARRRSSRATLRACLARRTASSSCATCPPATTTCG